MINQRLFIQMFCNNSKVLLSCSWAIFIRKLVLLSLSGANFSSFEYLFFVSIKFWIHSYLILKSKNRSLTNVFVILSWRLRSFNYALLFVLIQQNTVTFFLYSIRNCNAMTSVIPTKDNLWRKMLGKILKGVWEDKEKIFIIARGTEWN